MRYLVATDGSESSDLAVELAAADAVTVGAVLEIVHVLTPETELVDGELVIAGSDAAIERGNGMVAEARRLARSITEAREGEIEITTELLTGRPAGAIAEHAENGTVDRIYVGHRGLSAEREQVVGSVAKSLLGKATTPVTVVR